MFRFLLSVFLFGALVGTAVGQDVASVHLVKQAPARISKIAPGVFLVDFGRVAFGNLALAPATEASMDGSKITVRFGEALKNGRVDKRPPGTVRYSEVAVTPATGGKEIVVAPPPDARNTHSTAVLTPAEWGVLTPFRWVEVEGWPSELRPEQISRRAAFDSTWSDDAAYFRSSDPVLDQVWDLCHYSVKATTFAGIFIDGDRERLAYEADAFLNQMSYYAGDADPKMPRATFDRLIKFPTWPSEWTPHMVFMAYADWMQTGDVEWLGAHYEELKTKLLSERVGQDGLITSSQEQIKRKDIIDWPPKERDGYVFTSVNTVVNAFHLRALVEMAVLAKALGKDEEAKNYFEQERAAQAEFEKKLFNPATGLFRDGVGTEHSSLHANLFPLAFGLVPAKESQHVASWLAGRGMAASPYAAQYLLEGLFENGEDSAALGLITAPGDRSWKHMVDTGATITWEAWDQKYKPNQDWNHAWGTAPANLLPRFVLGVEPLTPGWGTASIEPHPGKLLNASGKVPTPRGAVIVSWTQGDHFTLHLELPAGMTAKVKLPALPNTSEIRSAGKRIKAHHRGSWWVLQKPVSGTMEIEER